MSTPHNSAEKGEIAKTVLMPETLSEQSLLRKLILKIRFATIK